MPRIFKKIPTYYMKVVFEVKLVELVYVIN